MVIGLKYGKTEPGDENNQDISSLVGKIDIRKLETFSQNDPDAYSYSGGLCLANRGVLERREGRRREVPRKTTRTRSRMPVVRLRAAVPRRVGQRLVLLSYRLTVASESA